VAFTSAQCLQTHQSAATVSASPFLGTCKHFLRGAHISLHAVQHRGGRKVNSETKWQRWLET
uniref:Uncharacterized protein n=1 Tax=Anopheles albimanus TaxID=7167 RepID=A0A182FYA8_ANOAL